ncbi:EpsG family protein [Latilactobacillus graminis]|uniref:ABC superfamily ATP binding cassette transporter permease subunit n=2 Tax=Latilactobacillus graminis TaxID=60519 RepID=A0AA89KWD1_9LACO|nr:EpsG family protein [Latilactobacillus graminis]KRM21028.1 ABC superfamily ATP binding cassette transporter permease subunit [Latilactobacillus graminis DSM 20719]QFP79163.1 EpsG family protein [Latilactobacillus graminis]
MIYVVLGILCTLIMSVPYLISGTENFGDESVISKYFITIEYVFIFILMVLLAGLRYNVGTDYVLYSGYQIPMVLEGQDANVEPLYQLLIRFGNMLGSYQWIFFFTHFIILFFILKFIKEQSLNSVLSIYILIFGTFYNFSLNVMRQSLATAIFLYSIKYIYEKRYFRYFFLILVAYFFHHSSILFVPFYFLRYFRVKWWKITPFIALITLFLMPIRRFLVNVFFSLDFYTNYFNSKFDNGHVDTAIIFINIFVLLIMLLVEYFEKVDVKLKIQGNIQIIAVFFSAVSMIIPNSYRINYLFIPIQIVLVPNLIKTIKIRWIKMILIGLVGIAYAILFYSMVLKYNYGETLPYSSVL